MKYLSTVTLNNNVNNKMIKTMKLYKKLPCDFSPVKIQRQTMNMTNVPISTVNITGLRNMIFGFNLINAFLMAWFTKSF